MARLTSIALIALALIWGHPAASETLPGPYPAVVVSVYDGDTFTARVRVWFGQDVTVTVRLAGIDAPERRGKCKAEIEAAEKARAHLAALLKTTHVVLLDVARDKYGRTLAHVTVPEGDVSELMLASGLVRPYHGEARQGWC